MAKKTLHPIISQLKQRALPVNYADSYVDQNGEIQNLDFKSEADSNTIKGYLCVWGVKDTYGTVFIRGCFAKSIAERGPGSGAKQKIGFLWQHDTCDPIGQFTVLKEDDYGLYFEAAVDDVPNGERALLQVESGTLNQFSIGFDYVWDMMEYDEASNGILIKECILYEGSIVTFGANAETCAVRSPEQLANEKENLRTDIEIFIRTIPRKQQLELRQLFTRTITLERVGPEQVEDLNPSQLRFKPEELPEPVVGGYKINFNEFKS